MSTATVLNIQRFSLHDGPGIRTTVFLKGCPLRCVWCHNPESLDPRPEPSLTKQHCIGCEGCAPVCEKNLTGRLDIASQVDHPGAECLRCGACASVCPTGAREMLGEDYTEDVLVAQVRRDQVYFGESGGGVTFSGGEPLAGGHAKFVESCLRRLAAENIHTAVDTCGYVPTNTLLSAAELADLILFDLKIMNTARHREATGRDNELILKNLETLLARDKNLWLRVPLIPGQTDDAENIQAIGDFLVRVGRRPQVSLLPYHDTARDKYPRLGKSYEMPTTTPLTADEIQARADLLTERGLSVKVGG